HDDGDVAGSRRGFYGYIDRVYTWMLHLVMRRRFIVGGLALLVMASSAPLYALVKQDIIPSNIDEAEFSGNLTAPEGPSLRSMNEALEAVEGELKQLPEARMVLGRAGSSFLGSLNSAEIYVRIPPHEERTINLTKFWNGLKNGDPLAVFRGNYSA